MQLQPRERIELDATGPNWEQAEYWNEQAGPKWVVEKATLDHMIRPYGDDAIDGLKLTGSESVPDVGCGTGQTSLQLASRIPSGHLLCVDIAEPMLARAQQDAKAEGYSNIRFERADAKTYPFEQAVFDVVFSRFGVMFFAAPQAAFSNLHRALKPGGQLRFVCWQPLSENEWISVPMRIVAMHAAAAGVELPGPPPPSSPGPLSLGDPAHLKGILSAAGFLDVTQEDSRIAVALGEDATLESAIHTAVQLRPAAGVFRELEAGVQQQVAKALRSELESYLTPEGVRLKSACWLVNARRA